MKRQPPRRAVFGKPALCIREMCDKMKDKAIKLKDGEFFPVPGFPLSVVNAKTKKMLRKKL